MTLMGANAGVDPRTTCNGGAVRGPESIIDGMGIRSGVVMGASGITLNGFMVRDGGNDAYNSGLHMGGLDNNKAIYNILTNNVIGVFPNGVGPLGNLVQSNRFDANNMAGPAGGSGIYVDASSALRILDNEFKGHTLNNPLIIAATGAGSHTGLLVSGNNFHIDNNAGSAIYALGITGGTFSKNQIASLFSGIRFGGADTDVAVKNNLFSAATVGVRVVDDGFGFGANSDIHITANSFGAMTAFAVANENAGAYSTPPLDASANWWGNNTLAGIQALIDTTGGTVDFTPSVIGELKD